MPAAPGSALPSRWAVLPRATRGKPPSRTATRSCPNTRNVHQTRAEAIRNFPAYTTTRSPSPTPSAPDRLGEARLAGQHVRKPPIVVGDRVDVEVDGARGCAPRGTPRARRGWRWGRYQVASRTRRVGSPSRSASHAVLTTGPKLVSVMSPLSDSTNRLWHGPPRSAGPRGRPILGRRRGASRPPKMRRPSSKASREDQPRAVTVGRLAAPRPELFFRPEEVETRSEVAREPVAAPPAPLDPREAPRRRVARAADGIDVEDQRRAAPVAARAEPDRGCRSSAPRRARRWRSTRSGAARREAPPRSRSARR